MIDISRTKFIVTAWPDNRWPVETVAWIRELTEDVELHDGYQHSVKRRDQICARNYAIKHVALASDSHFTHFVFIDRDVRPGPEAFKFLELTTDVKSCQMPHRSSTAWMDPDSFHDGLWCTSRLVLEEVGAPWFVRRYTDDGCSLVGCICQSFRDKAKAKGFSLSHGGWAEHDLDQSWC